MGTTTRRTFLKATGAGVAAGGISATPVGSAQEGRGIATPWLHVEGNEVRDPSDNQVILRGVNVADPRRLDRTRPARGKGLLEAIDYVTDPANGIAARLVRLPVHPGDIMEQTPIPHAEESVYMPDDLNLTASAIEDYCEEHLDDAVDYCEEIGVYCIVDYHRHWGQGQLPWAEDADEGIVNESLQDEVDLFWETIAPRYADRSHVIFEVYNEPTTPTLGGTPLVNTSYSLPRWETWREMAQPWVDTIRSHADNMAIIGSPNWSQYPEGGVAAPFDGEDLGYTYHIYPNHSISSDGEWDGSIEDGTDQDNGQGVYECYEEVPLFVTEFGWQPGSGHPMEGTTSGFGEPFFDWLEDRPIHWTAWCFDPTWLPAAVERPFETDDGDDDAIGDPYNDEIPTFCDDPPCEWVLRGGDEMGELTAQVLYEHRNDDVPEGSGSTGPSPPTSLTVESTTDSTIQLSWGAVSDAEDYVVYREGSEVDTTADTGYLLTGLAPSTTYTVGVAARNADGTSQTTSTTATTGGTGENHCQEVGAADGEQVDGQWVCDVSDDGLHRDVTADGEVAQDDVVHFFENQHRDAWKRDDLFDFSDSGSVGHGDVVALFEYVSL